MLESYLGEIRVFPFDFVPLGWLACHGQILAIKDFGSLFSVIGVSYGGDGRTTFALPDFRGRVALGSGQGAGLSNYTLGQKGGKEKVTLTLEEMPGHQHLVRAKAAVAADAKSSKPSAGALASVPDVPMYSALAINDGEVSVSLLSDYVGGNQSHNNMQPSMALNFCISLDGIFPSRP